MKRSILGLASAMILLSSPAWADLTGKWTASVDSPMGGEQIQLEFDLKADGNALSGSVAAAGMPLGTITDGKIDGSDVSFKLPMTMMGAPEGAPSIVIDYTGKLEGDELALVSTFSGGPGGEAMVTELTAKRAQ